MSSKGDQKQKILAVFAHADDETLLAGTLLSKLASEGHEVRVLCLAPGDEDRTARLHAACKELGVSGVETLRYFEGAMWPDESDGAESEIPLKLSTAPIADLVAGISGRVAEFGPDVVITHSSYGDYGHADHAATSNAVQLVVQKIVVAGNSAVRLYLLEWPRWVVRLNARLMKIGGRDIRRMGEDGRFNLLTALRAPDDNQVAISVVKQLAARRKASRLYAPEIARGPLPMRMLERAPLWLQRFFLGNARLRLVVGLDEFDGSSGL
ncbi:MAG: PIG-L family deacetylase [Chloroflexi bacterium]|nr:PIG-L family deacetylase [Chloroflexota bacterium]